MSPKLVAAALGIAACVGLAPGCARPPVGLPGLEVTAAAAGSPGGIAGTWRGSAGQIYSSLYAIEAACVVRIERDGAFIAACTPSPAANNLAKPATWSGRAIDRGDRVTFETAGPAVTLRREGNTLYGVASDPLTEADVLIRLERDRPSA
jgi:hypothetical protein